MLSEEEYLKQEEEYRKKYPGWILKREEYGVSATNPKYINDPLVREDSIPMKLAKFFIDNRIKNPDTLN